MMVDIPDYKPSQVVMGVPPLCGTMGKAEIEFGASLIVAACVYHGDQWQPLQPEQVGEAIQALLERGDELWTALSQNPFFRPDIGMLLDSKYAEKNADGGFVFTADAFEAMCRWVRPSS